MKKVIFNLIFSIAIMGAFLSPKAFANIYDMYKVIKIIDGDTVYIDFNNNNVPEQEEKVRLNGIDTFETKPSPSLNWQMKNPILKTCKPSDAKCTEIQYNLTQNEALGLGYYGKEFAKKHLLNKYVIAQYTGETTYCDCGRKLMSIYYDCKKNPSGNIAENYKPSEYCKNYEKEVLKSGLATVYDKSNLAKELKQYENIEKIRKNAKYAKRLELILLNKKNWKYHKPTCKYGLMASETELVKKPMFKKYTPSSCCYKAKNKKYIKNSL